MKILVIGGSGFLGSHLCDQLINAGHTVTNYDYSKSKWQNKKCKFIKGNLTESNKLDLAIKNKDYVYHFAGISDINESLNKPLETSIDNIQGTIKVMQYCVKHKVKRFLFSSSVYVYSNEGSFYRCSKQACEEYIVEFNKRFKLNYTILRFGSIYGPRSDYRNGVYRIIDNAINKKNISYEGNPDAIREYIHVLDAADSCIKMLDKKFNNQSFILTGHNPTSVKNFLNTVAEILSIKKNKIKFKNKKYPGHYVTTPYSYIPKAGKKFLPTEHTDLGQGLINLIEYIKRSQ